MNYNKSVWVDVFSEKDFRRYRKGRIVAKLINIGFGNLVSADRLVAVVGPDSAPIKRMVQEARDRGVLIDATYGRRTRAVLIMDNDHLVLSALQPETVSNGRKTASIFIMDSDHVILSALPPERFSPKEQEGEV